MDSLEEYLNHGVADIVKGILKASAKNPKASLFMARHSMDSREAKKIRYEAKKCGTHIPPFLIASITHQCNLHCKGCYARANHSCEETGGSKKSLTAPEWNEIFTQAEQLGIEFILLAGGEPFVRKDVLLTAGTHEKIIFPVFTNGTMMDQQSLQLLEQHRNLMPVLSIEGNQQTTDARRGTGVFQLLQSTMELLHNKGILFGASVTVTKENLEEVLSDQFLSEIERQGAKAVIFVEYVPVDESSRDLAPDDTDRERMKRRLEELRTGNTKMLLIAFPGDEKTSGGCLAAGRGFFHIDADGGAEPCPFSPYSDTNVKDTGLLSALQSPLFYRLHENGTLEQEHIGGCVLFEQKEQVEAFLRQEKKGQNAIA